MPSELHTTLAPATGVQLRAREGEQRPTRPPAATPGLDGPAASRPCCFAAAFLPTYFGRFPGFPGTSTAVHFHAVTMLAWLTLTIAQTILIRRQRFELHRRLGRLTYALLPLVAVGFWLVLRDGQLRHKQPDLILATAFDGFLFFFLVGMGLFYRKRRAYHGRFMMLSLVPFLNPTLGRLISPVVSVPFELLLMIALLLRARRRREDTRPYAVALTAFLGALAILVVVMVGFPDAPQVLWSFMFGNRDGR